MSRRVLKWPVPVDDETYPVGGGLVVHVAALGTTVVNVWTLEPRDSETERRVRVFGTGHEVPDGWEHIGSTVVSPFVWHVFEEMRF